MVETSALVTPSRRHEHGCDPVTCDFTVARVRVYLICWDQAIRHHESFEHVFGSVRHSRVGPRQRGAQSDPAHAIDVRLALEQARAAGMELAIWNVDKIAAWLCGNEHQEPVIDVHDFEALR